MKVHATAIVDAQATLAGDVEIGPFCAIGPGVRLGAGCRLIARVVLVGQVTAGERNVFHPNVVVGGSPSTLEPPPRDGRIEIGSDNVFREACTVHLPAEPRGLTKIGSRNVFHACSTVDHDCVIGDGATVGPFAGLGEHTVLEDEARVDGSGGTCPRVTVGRGARVRSHHRAELDVPPYLVAAGDRADLRAVGPRYRTPALLRAFEIVWQSDLELAEALRKLEAESAPEVVALVEFLRRPSASPESSETGR